MPITVGEAVFKFALDRTEFTRGLKDAEQEGRRGAGTIGDVMARELQRRFNPQVIFQRFQAGLDSLAKSATRTGTVLSVGLSAPLLLIGSRLVKLGLDAVEAENLFTVSMGRMADAARAWSQDLRASLGLNEFELRRMVAVFNNMLAAMGLSEQAAFDMSKALVELTFDMASFYNLQPAEVFQKLQAGITGEVEPLKRLGVVVNETTVKQFALTRGLIKQGQELSETGKIMARFGVIIEATKNAQGDLARTLDSPANKLRIMREQVNQASTELGMALLPAIQALTANAQPFVAGLTEIAQRFKEMDPRTRELIVKFILLSIALGPVLVGIGKVAGAFSSLIGLGLRFGPVARGIIGWFAGIGGGAAAAAGRVGQLAAALRFLGLAAIPVAVFLRATDVEKTRQRLLDIAKQDPRFAGLAKGLLAAPEFNLAQANQVIQAWERIHRAKTEDAKATKNTIKLNTDYQRTLAEIAKAAAAVAAKAGGGAKAVSAAIKQAIEQNEVLNERFRQIAARDAEDADAALRMRVQRYDEAYNAAVRILATEERLKELQEDRLLLIEATPRPREFRDETGERTVSLIEAARQRLNELGATRVRNIDLIQREISQLQIIVEQEAKREEQLTDQKQIDEARLSRLYAEAEIQDHLLKIARLRVDDARAILDLTQLEHSLGLATAAQVDAARRQALVALQAQLATAKELNATQAELIPILQDILRIQEDLIRGDFLASMRQAIAELQARTIDWLTVARDFFRDLEQGIASALRAFGTEGKTILETLGNLARAVFDAAFTQITNNLAQQLTQLVGGFLGRLIPGLGAAAGPQVALATAGVTLNTAGVGLNTAALALQAAAASLAGAGAGGFLGGLFGMQHGGIVTAPMLAPLAEAGRPEIVMPLPRGLRPQDLADTMRAVATGGGGGDTLTFHFHQPVVRSDDDIRRIGRSVADAMRMARRGNHPLWREGR